MRMLKSVSVGKARSNDEVESTLVSIDDGGFNKLNLPQIKIDYFDGEIKNWLPFRGHFKQMHLDESIPRFYKFCILLQSLIEDSPAEHVADSSRISMGNEKYDEVICALNERFRQEDLLIEVYIRKLL